MPYSYYLFAHMLVLAISMCYDRYKVKVQQRKEVRLIRSMSRIKQRNYFFNPEKDCLLCVKSFKDLEVVTIMKCHVGHYFHVECFDLWVD